RFFFQAEDGIRDFHVTGVQTCALPIYAERLAEIARQRAATESRLAVLKARWEKERELVGQVRALRERLEALVVGNGAAADAGQEIGRASCRVEGVVMGIMGALIYE